MGSEVCTCKKQSQNSTISASYGDMQGFSVNGEENIKETEDDSVQPTSLNVKVLNTIITPFVEGFPEGQDHSMLQKCSNSSWKIQPIQQSQWFKEWLQVFPQTTTESNKAGPEAMKKGIQNYENYLLSFMPKYKEILINDQNFFKIREEPIKEFYSMERKIGEGAFGSVYEGLCKKTGQKRAIKIIKRKVMKQNDIEMFKNQVNILKKMDHVNIIKIYDIFSFSNFFYVVTQYCEGGSLLQISQRKGLKQEKVIQIIMKQLLSALYYMHQKHIVHRDIKLQNVVLVDELVPGEQQNMCIKLIDFGLALEVTQTFGNKCGLTGTPSYMAPEILQGNFCYQSDIWSSGIIFSLLLTGQNPFKEKQIKKTYENIKNKKINFKDDRQYKNLSSQAVNLLAKMLEKIPYKRISSKNALNHQFLKEDIEVKNIKRKFTIVNNITNYTRGTNFTCFIKNFLISKNVTQSRRQEMAMIFQKIDVDASGMIDKQQLMELYRVVTGQSTAEAEQHIKKIDQNHSDNIDFHEFLLVMTNNDIMRDQAHLKQAFEFLDEDKTGYIEKEELLECLVGCEEQEIIGIIESIDGDGDGKISLSEFSHYMMNVKL